MGVFLSIIIPAYNEEQRISKSLETVTDFIKTLNFETEIIVVDDGSKDNTINVCKKFENITIIPQIVNKGKGAAVQRGMMEANGEIRIFTDADLSTPIHEINKILENIADGYDICIGSRALDSSMIKIHQPFYREWMGKIFNFFVQLLVFRGIHDTQCGFKGFTRNAVDLIFPKAKIFGFGFDVEILYLAKLNSLKVKEVPVEWFNDDRSTVSTMKGIDAFNDILKVRRLHKK